MFGSKARKPLQSVRLGVFALGMHRFGGMGKKPQIAISILRYRAPDAQMKLLYTRIAIALVAVLSLIATATFIADQFTDEFDLTLDMIMLTIGFALLSPLPHILILFAGKDAYEGKAYMLYLYLKRRLDKLGREFDERLKAVLAEFRQCERLEHHLRQEHNHIPSPALYTADARRIINAAFDAEMISPVSRPPEVIPPPDATVFRGDAAVALSLNSSPDGVRSEPDGPTS